MSSLTKKEDRDLFKILVAVAWIDGKVQPEERVFLEKIAAEQNMSLASNVEDLLNTRQPNSIGQCYKLLREYLGLHPTPEDYQNLLSAVSSLVYSDNDIATEEASLLTELQNLDPHNADKNLNSDSTFDKLIAKIQKIYRLGLGEI